MGYYKKLLGENVYLSPLSVKDTEKFAKWMNDFSVTDYTGRSAHVQTLEAEKQWIADQTLKNQYLLAIVRLDNNETIGNIALNNVDLINRCATLGIMIGEHEERSKGYGTEAINLLLDFGFNYLNLNSVMLTVFDCNKRAIRCYEKVGFKHAGLLRNARFVNGKYHNLVFMDILAEEFKDEFIKNKEIK